MKITAQPHIWPGRNLGLAFARSPEGLVLSSVCCLDCNWGSEWHTTTGPTHQAGHDHLCGVTPHHWPTEPEDTRR